MPLDVADIETNIRKLRKSLKRGKKRSPPDAVHKLRTRTKRFEAAAEMFASSIGRKTRRLLKPLKRIRKKAGLVRDADVLTGLLSSLHSDGERANIVRILEYLGATRYRRASRLRKLIRRGQRDVRKGLKRLMTPLDAIDEKKRTASESPNQREAAAQVLRLSEELAQPPRLHRGNLHEYRLKIKELRYALQMAKPNTTGKFEQVLGECKDAIGEWHDWEELIATAKEVLDPDGSRLLAELREISSHKFDRALAVTNRMRKSYAQARYKGRKPTRGPEPALKAASAISARAAAGG